MAKDYVMPKLAMAMNEGTVTEWLVQQGDRVEKGQALISVETEKVSYDCESPDAGYINIVVAAGETVPCDTLIAQFCDSREELESLANAAPPPAAQTTSQAPAAVAETPAASPAFAAPARASGERIVASPLARKMATDAGIDLALVAGTGPGGRIVKRDILAAQQRGMTLPVAAAKRELIRIPMSGVRNTIAQRMTQSLQSSAQLSSTWESDISDLLAVRQKFVAREQVHGTRVSVNAFLIKAIACAIREVPMANACIDGDEIVVYNTINMGIAVSLPGASDYDSSLVVAVLRNVESMGVVDIDIAMKALIKRIRDGEASAEDMSGSTITLSSTAGIAPPGLQSTPILNMPNAVLVGPSTPQQKPVVYKGDIVARTMMPMSLTFDHRMLDGEPAARFMKALHDYLESPELMLA